MTRVKKGGLKGEGYCITFDPIKCQLSHFEFAVAANFLVVGNLLEAIDFIIRGHLKSQSEKRPNYQRTLVVQLGQHRCWIASEKVPEPKFQTQGL